MPVKTPVKAKKKPPVRKAVAKPAKKAAPRQAPKPVNRLLADEMGKILQAEGAFAAYNNTSLRDCLLFESPDDALNDRPLLFSDTAKDGFTASILAGEHKLLPPENVKADWPSACRFDWIEREGRGRYLLISDNAEANDDFLEFLKPAAKAPPSQQKLEAIGKAFTSAVKDMFSLPSVDMSEFMTMTHDLMLVLDAQGGVLRANDTFCDILGYEEAGLNQMKFMDFIFGDDKAYVRPIFKSVLQAEDGVEGRLIAFECRVVARNSSSHWLEWRLKKKRDHIYALCRDLTDIKAHETSLLKHQQQLSEAQSIGRMGHWMWRVGEERIEFSPEIYRIFGVTPDKFTPTMDSVNSMLHRRDIGRMAQAFQRAMIERKNYEMEFRIIRPDGQARFILLQGRCEMDDDGDVSALFGIMQDVTERVSHERELRDAKEAAERAYAAKSQFLANMSHELRTPLNAIIGFSEMMQRQLLGPIGTEKYLDYISGIRQSGEHLLDLITDILDMSKIEAGKYELDLEEVNLSKTIRLAAHMMEGRALDGCVKIISEDIPDDMVIVADRRAIMQVMLNVLSNAVKFTEPGGSVTVAAKLFDSNIGVQVIDTGIGIPANKLKYVTKPFEQAAHSYSRHHEGSGLGLAITKDLVELHGGQLQLESTVGVGTSVILRLPYDASKTRRDKAAL